MNLRRFVTSNNNQWQRLTLFWSSDWANHPTSVNSLHYLADKAILSIWPFHPLFGDKFPFCNSFMCFSALFNGSVTAASTGDLEFEGSSRLWWTFLSFFSCRRRYSPLCLFFCNAVFSSFACFPACFVWVFLSYPSFFKLFIFSKIPWRRET